MTRYLLPADNESRYSFYTAKGELDELCAKVEAWREEKGFVTNWSNVPLKLMLIVSELSEALEAYRDLPAEAITALDQHCGIIRGLAWTDDNEKILDKIEAALDNFREEIADTAIRLFDLSASLGIDLENEIAKKMVKNLERPLKHGRER